MKVPECVVFGYFDSSPDWRGYFIKRYFELEDLTELVSCTFHFGLDNFKRGGGTPYSNNVTAIVIVMSQ